MSSSSFPGGTSLSHLKIYQDAAPDGICGGSPHMHLVSTEAYIVVGGHGALQTIDAEGFRETELEPGSVLWFTPGTLHRAVNHGELRVVILMSNAGLPEAGDAVLTFPQEIVADAGAYAEAAALGAEDGRAWRAAQRRDLAVKGFESLRAGLESGDRAPLEAFYAYAGALVRERATEWTDLIRQGPLVQAERSVAMAEAVTAGSLTHLDDGRLQEAAASKGKRLFGMCGRIRNYDVTDREKK